jgi:hypothetical protein
MRVDYQKLRGNVKQFLTSPASEAVWKEFENSVLFNLVVSILVLPIGLLLICTIVLARIGFDIIVGILKSFITLEVFRNQRKKLQNDPDGVVPMLVAGIIIGPDGHGVVLGTFSKEGQSDLAILGRRAIEFGKIYAEGAMADGDEVIANMLAEDSYIPGRRRLVPASHSDGREMLVFDMEIDTKQAFSADGVVWVACVAPRKEIVDGEPVRGEIVQIPWHVVVSAIR